MFSRVGPMMSTETKWTPGPWEAATQRGNGAIYGPEDEGVVTIVGYVRLDDTRERDDGTIEEIKSPRAQANARLIAAAPLMYEAHRAWEEVLVSMWGKHWPDVKTAQLADKAQRLMRAALAAADGREMP